MSKTAEKVAAFTQLCMWAGTVVEDNEVQEFIDFMKNEFGVRVKYHTQVKTLPDMDDGEPVEGTGGRNDLFFYIHTEDIGKFAVKRLQYGIRWWEDVLGNGQGNLYPKEFLAANPKTW